MQPRQDAARIGINLSPAQDDLLLRFHRLLLEKAIPFGMVGERDADRLYERHILDSLTAVRAFTEEDEKALDLGSGAGLPGIVLAIALPDCAFGLIESRRRRVGFLEYAVAALALENVEVVPARVEEVAARVDAWTGSADVATARAFAPAAESWLRALPLLAPRGRLVYFAGASWAEGELSVLKKGERPAISVIQVLERSSKLVIMSRQ